MPLRPIAPVGKFVGFIRIAVEERAVCCPGLLGLEPDVQLVVAVVGVVDRRRLALGADRLLVSWIASWWYPFDPVTSVKPRGAPTS
ncbi:hypothetical protein QA600_22125 [Natronococcus sp. A-GB1]|uniref:hypothetical protein n=1 Tax=Natronococcus sp. A-GB1 TaxID=3037648 RepID=UPI00241EE5DE|nr:hypothetical protein [Natronococcus sp. A-GB1]MDG5762017.1 hypothetical protein [Natronococcus sp. A-GB1]